MGYKEYLQTPHWCAIRDAKLEEQNYCCERCGFYAKRNRKGRFLGLHVHHKTYERIRNERMDDLEVLCIYCHECEHGRNTKTKEQIRAGFAAKVSEYKGGNDIEMELAQWDRLAEAAGF